MKISGTSTRLTGRVNPRSSTNRYSGWALHRAAFVVDLDHEEVVDISDKLVISKLKG